MANVPFKESNPFDVKKTFKRNKREKVMLLFHGLTLMAHSRELRLSKH